MTTTQDVLKAAQDLGKLIAEHPAAKKFEDTIAKLQADVEAQRLLNDYNRLLAKIGEKESAGKPIEVEDKRQLEKLQGGMVRNPLLRDFQLVQMDYLDLMRKVDEAMSGGGAEVVRPAGGAPASPLAKPVN